MKRMSSGWLKCAATTTEGPTSPTTSTPSCASAIVRCHARQRVESSVGRIDERGVEVLPASLVLLAAVVVIERVQHRVRGLRRGAEVDRGLAAPRADLEPRAAM